MCASPSKSSALILASASPARRGMLSQAGIELSVLVSNVDEAALKRAHHGTPESLALALAMAKAQAISAVHPAALVIGADQILLCGTRIFDKPNDLAQAAQHLRDLSGRAHQLISATCVYQNGVAVWKDISTAQLYMRHLSETFIAEYVKAEGDESCRTVGAYKIEGRGAQLFERIEGDVFTILGMNLLGILAFLRGEGVLSL